jgi:pimeloyl-ACP methyl ester carboxylesterase
LGRLLVPALARVELVEFDDLGHMGPLTDPDKVNGVIQRFLEKIG